MHRTTILADPELFLQLRGIGQRLGLSISDVIRQALQDYVERARTAKPRVSIIGAGASGGKLNLSERHEELLFVRDKPAKRSKR